MSNEILEILHDEQERIAKMLPSLDPRTTEYTTAVCNLSEVYYRICNFIVPNVLTVHRDNAFEYKVDCATDSVVRTPVEPEPTVGPVAEPVPPPAEPTAENIDWAAYRLSLRERMADARLKGVNITDLIKKVGADKFSAVPDDKLTELSDLLESAVKELE